MTLHEHPEAVDQLVSGASFLGAVLCAYLMQTTARERASGMHMQRLAFGLLGLALLANSGSGFGMIGAHRLTGVFVILAILFLLVVMAVRGRLSISNWETPRSRFESWRLWN